MSSCSDNPLLKAEGGSRSPALMRRSRAAARPGTCQESVATTVTCVATSPATLSPGCPTAPGTHKGALWTSRGTLVTRWQQQPCTKGHQEKLILGYERGLKAYLLML